MRKNTLKRRYLPKNEIRLRIAINDIGRNTQFSVPEKQGLSLPPRGDLPVVVPAAEAGYLATSFMTEVTCKRPARLLLHLQIL